MTDKNSKTELLNQFIGTMPGVIAFFGLGSNVFKQIGNGTKEGQIDGIAAIENGPKFHIKNMKFNPKYYSITGKLFFWSTQFKLTKQVQLVGADICYLTYIKYEGKTFKVGFIERQDLLDDLTNWKNLYMAGRFMKVMLTLFSDPEINAAIDYNRRSALIVSLLMLPEDKYNLYELYHLLISLSYKGDFRTGIKTGDTTILNFENPDKVNNLLSGNYQGYHDLYFHHDDLYDKDRYPDFKMIDHSLPECEINKQVLRCFEEININPNIQQLLPLVKTLPTSLQVYLQMHHVDINDLPALRIVLADYFTDINSRVTFPQGIKGIFTSGPINTVHYIYDKGIKAATKTLKHK